MVNKDSYCAPIMPAVHGHFTRALSVPEQLIPAACRKGETSTYTNHREVTHNGFPEACFALIQTRKSLFHTPDGEGISLVRRSSFVALL